MDGIEDGISVGSLDFFCECGMVDDPVGSLLG